MRIKLLTCALLLTGCASQVPDLSSDHWTFDPPEWRAHQASAEVFAPSAKDRFPLSNGNLGVTCFVDTKQLMFSVSTSAKLSGSGSDRVLTMAFDGEAPKSQKKWQDNGQGFSLFDDDPRFPVVVAQLRSHRQVEFVSKDSFGELWRGTFTLTGADAAIAQVLEACGKG
jgi:hypothetical protein